MLVVLALAAGCTAGPAAEPREEGAPADVAGVRLAALPKVAVLGRGDVSVPASEALFDSSPVVVVVAAGADLATATSRAEELAVPLLVVALPEGAAEDDGDAASGGPAGADPAAVVTEVERLGAEQVVAADGAALAWAQETLAAEVTDGASAVEPLQRGRGAEGRVVMTTGRPSELAAVATARAAGATVLEVPGADPRADGDLVERLSAEPPTSVLALSPRFGDAETLGRRMDVVETGVQLPGGGQVPFPGRHMVALYGYPGAPSLGVLGEQDLDATVERAQRVAAAYEDTVQDPVVPTFEIITTVASGAAGADGDFSNESDPDDVRPWIEAAEENGIYVLLDLQPGRSDFLTQARRYRELLAYPHVGLALDPEWRLGPRERHLEQIGQVGVDEVNRVADWLAELTRERRLPPKVFLLHQFQQRMVEGRERLDMSHDELVPLVHADGHGTPGQKRDTYRALQADAPAGMRWGWKNFYDEDTPTMSPAETMDVRPVPDFVSYQ